MIRAGDEFRNAEFTNISSQPLPQSHLQFPEFGMGLAHFQAETERKQAIIDLDKAILLSKVQLLLEKSHCERVSIEKEKLERHFIDSNQVVNENKTSISRYYEIIRQQKDFKVLLETEINNTQIDIEDYKKAKKLMEKYVRQYSMFENFLENVATDSKTGDLLSVRDILNRYKTLEWTRGKLKRILEGELESLARVKEQILDLLRVKSSVLETLKGLLFVLQESHRLALDKRLYWEVIIHRIKTMILDRKEEAMMLRDGCWDFYRQICIRRKVQPSAPTYDIETQLDYIQKSIGFYKQVLTTAASSMAAQENNQKNERL